MFTDYYSVLEIPFTATAAEIREAFRKQAIRWHPDKNPDADTTEQMKLVNEAYIILRDPEARQRYNAEYSRYTQFINIVVINKNDPRTQADYVFSDEQLRKWMTNAGSQARNLARESLDDLLGMTKAGGKAIADTAIAGVGKLIGFSILMLIIMKACGK